MGKTLAEKILSRAYGEDLKAGQTAVIPLSLAYFQDGTGPLGIRQIQKLNINKLANPKRSIFFIDHSAPSPRKELSNEQSFIRTFAKDTGAIVHDIGDGVCHQIAVESYVRPYDVVIGGDSHTCMGGGLGAFATGMGSTDVGIGMALGKSWFRVPETIRIELEGRLKDHVTAKDIILTLIGQIGADGATYKALEFGGKAVKEMPMQDRFTIANMAVEAGAKAGLFEADARTRNYLINKGRGEDFKSLEVDKDAEYERVITMNLDTLVPVVSFPHTVDNIKTIDEAKGVKLDQVFIGTCTNGRIDDLRETAKILNGKKVSTRTIIIPASRQVYILAAKEGLMEIFATAGATIMAPGCGPCVGIHAGVLGDDENCLATQNRNFQGRMGNPKGNIYLSSPVIAACSAITGEITDPREFLNR